MENFLIEEHEYIYDHYSEQTPIEHLMVKIYLRHPREEEMNVVYHSITSICEWLCRQLSISMKKTAMDKIEHAIIQQKYKSIIENGERKYAVRMLSNAHIAFIQRHRNSQLANEDYDFYVPKIIESSL